MENHEAGTAVLYSAPFEEVSIEASFLVAVVGHCCSSASNSQNLDLLVNGAAQDWLGSADGKRFLPHTYSQNHLYRLVLVGNGQPVSFRIYDTSHDWNEGTLTVSISRMRGQGRLP